MVFWRRADSPDLPISFGYKVQWLAAQATDPARVARAVGLRRLVPASWARGVGKRTPRRPFVTPVLDGWVLVVEYAWAEDPVADLARVSAQLETRVCQFASHRGVNLVAWALADRGDVQRAYAHADGTTYQNHGAPTADERELGLRYAHELNDTGEVDDATWDALPDEETIVELARRWSLDPTTLDERFRTPSLGWQGRPSS